MILDHSFIRVLLSEPNSQLDSHLTAVQSCLLHGIHDEECILSVLRGMPHVTLKLFHMVDDFTATLRNISFVAEYVNTHSMCELQQEYVNALNHYTLDESIQNALCQWKSFTQLSSLIIKNNPEWAQNMALNQSTSSWVYQDTKQSLSYTQSRNSADECQETMLGTYPLYWTNKPSAVENSMLLMEYRTGRCRKVAASKLGKCMVAIAKEWSRTADDVFLYDMNTGELLHQIHLQVWVRVLSFENNNKNSNNLWIGCSDGSLRMYDTATGALLWTSAVGHYNSIISIPSVGEDNVLCATNQGDLIFFSFVTRSVLTSWSAGEGLNVVVYHPDKCLIITAYEHCISFWKMNGVLIKSIDMHATVHDLTVHPINADFILCSSGNRAERAESVQQVSIESGKVINTIHKAGDHVDLRVSAVTTCLKVSYVSEGRKVVCVSQCGTYVLVYDTDGNLINKIQGKRREPGHNHIAPINDICVLPIIERIITVGEYGCTLFSIPSTRDEHVLDTRSEILGCCLLPNGAEFITLSEEGELSKWSTKTYEKICTQHFTVLWGCFRRRIPIAMHPDGNTIVFDQRNQGLEFMLPWVETTTLQPVAKQFVQFDECTQSRCISDIVISRKGNKCVVEMGSTLYAHIRYTTLVYDIKDLHKIKEIDRFAPREGHTPHGTSRVDIHHEEDLVVTACDNGVSIWKINTKDRKRLREGRASYVQFAYEPDRIMCVQHCGGEVYSPRVFIMDLKGDLLCSFPTVLHRDHSVLLINNDTQLITGNRDNSLQIHDAHTGQTLYTFFHFSSEGFGCLDFALEQGILIAANKNDRMYVLKTAKSEKFL